MVLREDIIASKIILLLVSLGWALWVGVLNSTLLDGAALFLKPGTIDRLRLPSLVRIVRPNYSHHFDYIVAKVLPSKSRNETL